ncbi:MAG: hypothetical protein ACYC0P_11925, partial [Thiobacillus sp.]
MERQPHGFGLREYVEDAGTRKTEFIRQRLARMKTAVGQMAQNRKQRFVGSCVHLPDFTWLGGGFSPGNKKPPPVWRGFLAPFGADKESDDDLLSQARCLLSLARERFT